MLAHTRSNRFRRLLSESEAALEPLSGWAVSWSGGKDSGVCVDLAGRVWEHGTVIMSDNGSAPNELRSIWHLMAARFPQLRFVWRESLSDDRADRADVRWLIRHLDVPGIVLGLRADESGYRQRATIRARRDGRYTASAEWGSLPVVCPIVRWSLTDVWAYHELRDLPRHPVYELLGPQARTPHGPQWDWT
jgi:3'-phosphoadenosine 5'-phosphosulfate sulfotransferase (PAPS reductase)/FAD synthetase